MAKSCYILLSVLASPVVLLACSAQLMLVIQSVQLARHL